MSLTINLKPELEERLRHEAAKLDVEPGEYAGRLIEQQLKAQGAGTASLWDTLPPEEWGRVFDEYLARHDPTKPSLPPEAFERASFYGERG